MIRSAHLGVSVGLVDALPATQGCRRPCKNRVLHNGLAGPCSDGETERIVGFTNRSEGSLTGTQIVRDTLARHREQPSIGLDLTFPINWQLDVDLARMLSKDLRGAGTAWEVRRATPSLGDMVPAKCGLYMFVYRSHLDLAMAKGADHQPSWVLYVGRAGNAESARTLKDRYRGEYARYVSGDIEQLWSDEPVRGRAQMLQRYLCLWPLEYWFLVVEDRTKIVHLEDRLIKLLSPPLNSYGRLRIKASAPSPAFRTR